MRRWRRVTLAAALAAGIAAAAATVAGMPAAERRSGYEMMAPATRAMQADDTANPGMLWVATGERLWAEPPAAGATACAGCHGDARTSMRGVAARYPAFDAASAAPIDLAGRIGQCRQQRQGAEPFARESEDLLALTAYVAHQSRGMPIAPPEDPRLAPYREAGRALYERRLGQLDLACGECHDARWGSRLGGNVVPQAHPTGYPLYRLEWQSLGSLQRRLRNCMIGVRAEPYAYGARELVELELYLMTRAAGMAIETPAVRP